MRRSMLTLAGPSGERRSPPASPLPVLARETSWDSWLSGEAPEPPRRLARPVAPPPPSPRPKGGLRSALERTGTATMPNPNPNPNPNQAPVRGQDPRLRRA